MTHSLHRHGNADSLKRDYVVLALSQPVLDAARKRRSNAEESRVRSILKAVYRRFHVNKLFALLGIRNKSRLISWTAVFDSREDLDNYLEKLKKADTGRSVVVSGLFDDINESIARIGLRPHTVQYSLGCFGATDLLPKPGVLEVTTLCGHHMVAPKLVETLAANVAKRQISTDDAVESMNKMCLCKIFNKLQAEGVMKTLAEQHRHTGRNKCDEESKTGDNRDSAHPRANRDGGFYAD